MKTFSLLLFLLVSTIAAAQQDNSDVIYLKDGSVLKGKIIERLDDGAIKMKMNGGREIVVSMKEVKQVTIEGIGTNTVDYGGKTAFGLSLIGDGGIGAHFRFMAAKETFFDLGVEPELRALTNRYTNDVISAGGIAFGGEINHFLERRYKESKQKVRANGLFFRVSHAFSTYETTRISGGWSSEYFKLSRFKRGFLLNLGIGIDINHWVDNPLNYAYTKDIDTVMPNIHFRIQWNFFQ